MSTNGRPIPPMSEADEKRFWVKVSLPDGRGCMEWAASKFSSGYGQFRLGDSTYLAHRVAWTLANGPIPPGKVLDHLCRNKTCVAPGHLEVVDSRTNTLRGEGPTAKHATRTHCPRGHAYTPENTYHSPPSKHHPNGYRYCRTCQREHQRAHRLRKRPTSADSTEQLQVPLTPRTGLDAP